MSDYKIVVDNIVPDTGGSSGTAIINPLQIWQSFTVGTDGFLEDVQFNIKSPLTTGESTNIEVTLYKTSNANGFAQNGNINTFIIKTNIMSPDNSVSHATYVNISFYDIIKYKVYKGETYIVLLKPNLVQRNWIRIRDSNVLEGGRSNINSNYDYVFQNRIRVVRTLKSTFLSPQKGLTSSNEGPFSMGRILFTKTMKTIIDETNDVKQEKQYYGERNRDASSVIARRKMVQVSNKNHLGDELSYQENKDTNNVRQAIKRVRSGGAAVPAKVTQKNINSPVFY